MNFINFTYTLDVVYKKKGVDHRVCRKEREEGKDISGYYNNNKTSIYLSWSFAGKYYKENVGYRISPCQWNFSEKLPSKKYCNYLELSAMLKGILSSVERLYLQMRIDKLAITADTIREMVRGIINGPIDSASEKKGLFWRVFDEFLLEKAQLTKPSTVVKYKSLQKTLQAFEKAKYPMTFEAVTMKWYTDFMIYSVGRGRLNNTISKDLTGVKSLMNYAYDRKHHKNLEFKRFRCPEDYGDPIFLTVDEIAAIENYDTGTNASQSMSRDIFLLACFTGARSSDLLLLKKKHLKILADGEMEWELFQAKGRRVKAVKIFIVQKARKILDKYLDGKKQDDFIFSQSPVVTNRNIKIICKNAGSTETGAGLTEPVTKTNYSGSNRIMVTLPKWKWVSIHSGRRSFITHLCANNMPDHEIQSLSGHASSKEIRPYRGILSQNVRAGLIRTFE